jgi:hypothetical protein
MLRILASVFLWLSLLQFPCIGHDSQAAARQIPYTPGFQVNTHVREKTDDDAIIITSRTALRAYLLTYGDVNNLLAPQLTRYDRAWFRNNALVLITRTEGSGSIRHTITDLALRCCELTVYFERSLPGMGTDDMAAWVFALEAQKSDIRAARSVRAVYDDVRLPCCCDTAE